MPKENDPIQPPPQTVELDAHTLVDFMPVCHQYRVGVMERKDFKEDNLQKVADQLGVAGVDGWLLQTTTPSPDDPNLMLLFFVRTGVKRPKHKIQVPGGPKGIVGPNGTVL